VGRALLLAPAVSALFAAGCSTLLGFEEAAAPADASPVPCSDADCGCAPGQLAIDQLRVDVDPGPEGVYHCDTHHDGVDGKNPPPCEPFHAVDVENAFYVHANPQAPGVSLQTVYWCGASARHFLSLDLDCGDIVQPLVNEGVFGHIATEPACGATALHQFWDSFDNDRVYVLDPTDPIAKGYVAERIIGYVWTSPGAARQ
jgi:hypothetical protein